MPDNGLEEWESVSLWLLMPSAWALTTDVRTVVLWTFRYAGGYSQEAGLQVGRRKAYAICSNKSDNAN